MGAATRQSSIDGHRHGTKGIYWFVHCNVLSGTITDISPVPVYAAENAPTSIRGALVMSWRKLFDSVSDMYHILTHNEQKCGLLSVSSSELL